MRRPVEPGVQFCVGVAAGFSELHCRQAHGAPEVGPFEMRMTEVGPFEMCVTEVGPFKMHLPEVGPFEMRLPEVGPSRCGRP